jgi:hypothetical protein
MLARTAFRIDDSPRCAAVGVKETVFDSVCQDEKKREVEKMPILDGRKQERQGILEIARSYGSCRQNCPESRGKDVSSAVVTGPDEAIAGEMEDRGQRNAPPGFDNRDHQKADAIVIGVRGTELRPQLRRLRLSGRAMISRKPKKGPRILTF